MIPEKFLFRVREDDVAPVKIRCSTEKFVGDIQPYLDQEGNLVTEGVTHFVTEQEAWGALLSRRKQALEAAQIALAEAKIKLEETEKLVERLALAHAASLAAFEGGK